jgi:tryptophan-rich sensory protein
VIFASIVLVQFVGWRVTSPAIPDWYVGLAKPWWTPPNWLFGPVWTALYLMMGVAACLVWGRRAEQAVGLPLTLFGAQLASNLLWSVLFFWARAPWLGLADIGLLWALIAATAVAFFRVRRAAGLLLLPYLGWVSYAAALNAAIVALN